MQGCHTSPCKVWILIGTTALQRFTNPRLLQCGHMMNVMRGLSCVQPAGKLLRCRPFASRSHAASLHAATGMRSSGLTCRAAADVAQQASEGTAAAAPPPKVRG